MHVQELVIWRSTLREKWRKQFFGFTVFSGIVLGGLLALLVSISGNPVSTFSAFAGGLLLLAGPGAVGYMLSGKLYDYVVTNRRAMLRRFGKVVKEVPLNAPNLVITSGDQETYTRWGMTFSHVDIVFTANGVELLRFKKVDVGKANELFGKLQSMGFSVT